MSRIDNETCLACDGRGFKWRRGEIANPRTGETVADYHTRGEACLECFGSGKRKPVMSISKATMWAIVWLVIVCAIFSTF